MLLAYFSITDIGSYFFACFFAQKIEAYSARAIPNKTNSND